MTKGQAKCVTRLQSESVGEMLDVGIDRQENIWTLYQQAAAVLRLKTWG